MLQARLYDPYTEAFLLRAGIRPGMHVLDVGSGIGNLSLLAAKLVGKTGQVVGIDADQEVSKFAITRAESLGQKNVKFVTGDPSVFDFEGEFDAIIGRLILMHIEEPAALLKQLRRYLCPGGIIAFEEIASLATAIPTCSYIDYVNHLFTRYFERLGVDRNFGYKLPQIFQAAGLVVPALDYFAPAGAGPDWLGYKWLAEGVKVHMPLLHAASHVSGIVADIETLEDCIRKEAIANHSTATIFHHIGAFTAVP